MAPITPKRCVNIDPKKKPWEQEKPLHNRWHPDIPPVDTVKTHEVFRVECQDWTGGQIHDTDDAEDMKNIDLTSVHNLSGPIRVEDTEGKPAMPGDLLVVEILDIGALEGDEWGFTGIFDRENGGGFLTDHFPDACKAIWQFEGIWCSSRHIPGVRFPGLIHPGLIGTAPSHELLDIWNTRERELAENGEKELTLCKHLHARPLALVPEPKGCCLGTLKQGSPEFEKVAKEAARTIPGRENGGNCDIKNLTKGCKVYFPVFVEGANLSVGDIHFSQGDGEVSFCGAIEMSGFLHFKCDIMRGGMEKYLTPMGPTKLHVNPIFEISPLEPRFSEWLVFEGLSVDEQGKQHFLDASIAYKRAVLNCIHYLSKFGYTEEQIYLLLSCCPCEGRISGIVDVPNSCCTLAIPIAIFDQDIRPKHEGPPTGPRLIKRGDCPRSPYEGKLPLTVNQAAK
jgi:formamidase